MPGDARGAYHVAGQAVVAYLCGYTLRRGVTIDPMVARCWRDEHTSVRPSLPCAEGACDRDAHGAACLSPRQAQPEGTAYAYSGGPTLEQVLALIAQDGPDRAQQSDELTNFLRITLAGALAEEKHTGHVDEATTSDDRLAVDAVLAALRLSEDEHYTLSWVSRAAAQQQLDKPRVWALVEAVAAALLAEPGHTLGPGRFGEIIERLNHGS